MTVTTEEAERLARLLDVFPVPANALRSLAAERDALQAKNARLREALDNLVSYVDLNECRHENTHRGVGPTKRSIWTVCSECGAKWADDEGGFRPYCEPTVVTEARAALGEKE